MVSHGRTDSGPEHSARAGIRCRRQRLQAAARLINYLVLSRLTVTVSGTGTVSPNLNDRSLAVGAEYRITARPGSGFIFSGWSGGVESAALSLNFRMQSDLLLEANFIPNPYGPARGNYAGLFSGTNGATFENSGWFSATVTSGGRFSSR